MKLFEIYLNTFNKEKNGKHGIPFLPTTGKIEEISVFLNLV